MAYILLTLEEVPVDFFQDITGHQPPMSALRRGHGRINVLYESCAPLRSGLIHWTDGPYERGMEMERLRRRYNPIRRTVRFEMGMLKSKEEENKNEKRNERFSPRFSFRDWRGTLRLPHMSGRDEQGEELSGIFAEWDANVAVPSSGVQQQRPTRLTAEELRAYYSAPPQITYVGSDSPFAISEALPAARPSERAARAFSNRTAHPIDYILQRQEERRAEREAEAARLFGTSRQR